MTDAGWVLVGGAGGLFAGLLGAVALGSRGAVLDEVRAGQFPPQTRLMLDMARAGVCGQPMEDRRRWAAAAQEVGEWAVDRAVAGPAVELSEVLRSALDEEWSRQLCAHGLGAAWRAEHPFRRDVPGDPYDVLHPHADDAAAVLALDRARRLPRVPAALVERGGEVAVYEEFNFGGPPTTPYSRSLALALLGAAEAEIAAAQRDGLAAEAARLTGQTGVGAAASDLDAALAGLCVARLWVEHWPLRYVEIESTLSTGLPRKSRPSKRYRAVDERLRQVTGLARRAVEYVRGYAALVPALRAAEEVAREARVRLDFAHKNAAGWRARGTADDDARVQLALRTVADDEAEVEVRGAEERRLQALFPDFYPEAA